MGRWLKMVLAFIAGATGGYILIKCMLSGRNRAMIKTFDSAERIKVELSQVLSGEYPDDRRVTIMLAYCGSRKVRSD
jgi:hypothetical protein